MRLLFRKERINLMKRVAQRIPQSGWQKTATIEDKTLNVLLNSCKVAYLIYLCLFNERWVLKRGIVS